MVGLDSLKILLAEDNPSDTHLLHDLLVDARVTFSLEHVTYLEDIPNKLLDAPFDIILLDLSLPDRYSLDSLEKLSADKACPPVVVLTNLDDVGAALSALRAGASDYLVKGQFDGPALVRAIRYTLERDQIDSALQASQARLESIFNSLNDIAWSVTASGETLYMSYNTEAVYGYPVQAFYDDPDLWQQVIHPEDRILVERYWQEIKEEGQKDIEYRVIRADGQTRWLYDRGRAVYKNGLIDSYEGLVSDVTERKQAEEALRESEANQRALLRAIPDLLLQYAPDGTYLSYHASRHDDLYTEPEHFLGKHISDVMPPDIAELTQHYLDVARKEGEARFEYELEVLAGRRAYEAHVVRTDKGNTLSLIRDITERKAAEEQLR